MKIKPGVLCYVNNKCMGRENIGLVVEVVDLNCVIEGINYWNITSKTPIHIYYGHTPGGIGTRCMSPEYMLTPISGDGLLDDEHQENHNDVPELLRIK